MRHLIIGLIAVGMGSAAHAQTMKADDFYGRATKLQKKGALAMFSMGEVKALMREGEAAGKKAGEQRRADLAAARKPRFCPPAAKASMTSDDVMKGLAAIPPAERARIDMTEAMTRILAGKYPCQR